VGRIGGARRAGRGQLKRSVLRRAKERIRLDHSPRFIYGNADEGGFFRPLHEISELHQLAMSPGSLSAVERMGLVDHQWALVRAGRATIGSLLDLATGFPNEVDADVLTTLCRPLGFIARSLIPDAAPQCEEPFRAQLLGLFEEPFEQLGWKPATRESDAVRLRRAALLRIAGGLAQSPALVQASARHCDRYLSNRRALDANLADAVVAIGARVGNATRHRRFVEEVARSTSPQEQRRFLLALGEFRDEKLIDKTLALTLSNTTPVQDVVFVLVRLLANPSAKERSWKFVMRRWDRLRKRIPPLLASRLIEATPSLLTEAHRREVAKFFRDHPVPSGERALRQTLERFAWYKGFRRQAAADLTRWLGV
jgi:puromycin-sensitive aminopeptidase